VKKSSRMDSARRRYWRRLRRRLFVGSFAVDTNYSLEMTDLAIDVIEDRVSALEEIIAARWPRSMFLRRRLARELRASSATLAWAGPAFRARRGEAMSEDIAVRQRPRTARGEVAAGRRRKRRRDAS
jgi:hypothetical protein